MHQTHGQRLAPTLLRHGHPCALERYSAPPRRVGGSLPRLCLRSGRALSRFKKRDRAAGLRPAVSAHSGYDPFRVQVAGATSRSIRSAWARHIGGGTGALLRRPPLPTGRLPLRSRAVTKRCPRGPLTMEPLDSVLVGSAGPTLFDAGLPTATWRGRRWWWAVSAEVGGQQPAPGGWCSSRATLW